MSASASVVLTDLWLSSRDDPSDEVSVPLMDMSETPSKDGAVRTYAGGRRRYISRAGSGESVTVRVRLFDRSLLDDLRARRGLVQLLRDDRGRRIWGVYGDLQVQEIPGPDGWSDVSFTLTSITVTEAV